ncbi:hypothetical protein Ddc_02255 [Ditylenchus destructor]|nr:hypothetical protein Ddc_02255 [Ditylenchus destructor]
MASTFLTALVSHKAYFLILQCFSPFLQLQMTYLAAGWEYLQRRRAAAVRPPNHTPLPIYDSFMARSAIAKPQFSFALSPQAPTCLKWVGGTCFSSNPSYTPSGGSWAKECLRSCGLETATFEGHTMREIPACPVNMPPGTATKPDNKFWGRKLKSRPVECRQPNQ